MLPTENQKSLSPVDRSSRRMSAGPQAAMLKHRAVRIANGRRLAGRRGASAVEFAIVAPVFFMMIIGFLEFGRALMVQQVLINASRVGVRQAVTLGATSSEVSNTVQDYTSSVSVPGVATTVSPSPDSAAPGDSITVVASVNFSQVSWMTSPWFLGGKTLIAESTMRKEGFE